MRDAVIVEAVRTPLGKRNGGLKDIHPADLSAHVLRALIHRTEIDPVVIDDVIWGCVSQVGEQTFDIARTAALSAGWPESIPGTTVDRQCGSSQQAVHFAAAGVIAGHYDVVVAGGVESMSRVPMMSAVIDGTNPLGLDYQKRYGADFPNQGLAAEAIADKWGLDRQAVDAYSLRSHARAESARSEGRFGTEISPITTPSATVVDSDEGIRPGGSLQTLGNLRPAFRPDGVVTAGNSSQITDGSAALLITTSERARELGVRPLARVHTAVVVGADPKMMLTAPIPATQMALERSGLSLSEIGVFEVNEAFASVALAWHAEFDVPADQLNPNGGAIALGHPLGGSGARIMTTMVNHMQREGIRYGLQTMCEGGGQANATVLELL